MNSRINTILFDMDGTVLDTLDDLTDSVNHVLAIRRMPLRTREEYRQFFGNGIRYALSQAVPENTEAAVIDEMIPVFKAYYDRHCLDKTRPYDGIPDLMRALKKQGYKLAIVSNKIDSAVKELNDRFFAEYVDAAMGETRDIRRKPAADMVMAALTALNSTREETVYVGDSEVDLETARNAGIPCITALWGFRDRDFLLTKGAAVFAETPEEVLSVLDTFGGMKTP